jgi:hypothetical protein
MEYLDTCPASSGMVKLQLLDGDGLATRSRSRAGDVVALTSDTGIPGCRAILARSIAQDIEAPLRPYQSWSDRKTQMQKAEEYAALLDSAFCGGIDFERLGRAIVVRLLNRDSEESEAFTHWLRQVSGQAITNPDSTITNEEIQ